MKDRISWNEYFMSMALLVSKRSSCLSRNVGAVLVKDNQVLATGYNGSPSGFENCCDKGHCIRQGSKSGENLSNCFAVHAEQNCITQCAKNGISSEGSTMFVTCKPCETCMKMIIQSGIKKVIYLDFYDSPITDELARLSDVELIPYKETEE